MGLLLRVDVTTLTVEVATSTLGYHGHVAKRASLSTEQWAFWDVWMRAQRLLAQEVDRALQQEFGISKAEFSVLVTLRTADNGRMRVTDVADSLGWDKSRVAHQLTRMERRELLARGEAGAPGRRTSIELTSTGADLAERAVVAHGRTIRRLALDRLTPDQAETIGRWSSDLVEQLSESPTAAVADVSPPASRPGTRMSSR